MTESQLSDQAALAALFTLGLEGAKSIPWIRWIGDHAPGVSRTLSALFAALVAAGFTWQFTGDIVAGGVLTVTVPALATVLDFGKTAVIQYVMQHGGYKLAFGIPGKGEVGERNVESGQIPADHDVAPADLARGDRS